MAKKKAKKGKYKKAKKIMLGVLIGYVALLVIAYGIGVFYYSNRFLSGTEINGMDCSGKTVEEVENNMESQIASYQLVLKERGDKSEAISASQISMEYISDGKIQELKEQQNPFTWFLAFARQQDYTLSATTSYDETALNAAVDALDCFKEENVVQPVDAHLEVQDGQYVIVEETQGTALDSDKVKEAVKNAIDSGETLLDLDQAGCYIEPSVLSTDENLAKQRDEGNKLLTVTVTIDFSDRQEVIDADVMKDWLTTNEEGAVDLDRTKVREYVQQLQYEYDTFGSSREFTTSSGQTITVSGGDYGWLIAPNDTTTKIIDTIKSGQSQTIEPEYTYTGYCRDTNDIGYTYVEIDLPNHRLVVYRDGVPVVDTGILSSSATPEGVYKIQDMQSPADVNGKTVNYRISFGEGLGIQDDPEINFDHMFTGSYDAGDSGSGFASWAGTGGNVLVSVDQAALIWQNVTEDMPIVVYKN